MTDRITLRYDICCYFNMRSKADISHLVSLIYRMEPKNKSEQKLKVKDGYAQKYR